MLPAPSGFENIEGLTLLGRHRHSIPFAAVVLTGGYEESGDAGRFRAAPGDVLIHNAFEAHRDSISRAGARTLNLACPIKLDAKPHWRVSDLDALANLARQDIGEASILLGEIASPNESPLVDWPDLLASELRSLARFSLANWAATHGLSPESISRGFRSAFGVTPQRYRADARARIAISEILKNDRPLAGVAADLGFSDQAHMTRAIRTMSGVTPRHWKARAPNDLCFPVRTAA